MKKYSFINFSISLRCSPYLSKNKNKNKKQGEKYAWFFKTESWFVGPSQVPCKFSIFPSLVSIVLLHFSKHLYRPVLLIISFLICINHTFFLKAFYLFSLILVFQYLIETEQKRYVYTFHSSEYGFLYVTKLSMMISE